MTLYVSKMSKSIKIVAKRRQLSVLLKLNNFQPIVAILRAV